MRKPAPQKLRLEMFLRNETWAVRLRGGALPRPEVIETDLMAQMLGKLHDHFRGEAQALLKGNQRQAPYGKTERTDAQYQRCQWQLRQLAGLGRQMLRELFRPEALRLLQNALLAVPSPAFRDAEPPVLELCAEERAFFPLDMLPLLNFRNDMTGEWGLGDLETYASRFPAISMQTIRLFNGPVAQTAKLPSIKPLPVATFAHRGGNLTAHERELGFLYQMAAFHTPEPPQPEDGNEAKTLENLTEALKSSHGLVHLSCHAETRGGPGSACLILRAPGARREVRLRLDTLAARLLKRRAKTSGLRSLVFFNSCGSMYQPSHVRSDGAIPTSFARLLWENGHVGFIGTETNVSDEGASVMAKLFYHYFYAGHSAARALQLARQQLLRSKLNPIGLSYCYHGPSSLRVCTPQQWFYPPVPN